MERVKSLVKLLSSPCYDMPVALTEELQECSVYLCNKSVTNTFKIFEAGICKIILIFGLRTVMVDRRVASLVFNANQERGCRP